MDAALIVLLGLAIVALAAQPAVLLFLGQRAAGQLLAKHYEHMATHQQTGEPVAILDKRLDLARYQAETQRKRLEVDLVKHTASVGESLAPSDPEQDWG